MGSSRQARKKTPEERWQELQLQTFELAAKQEADDPLPTGPTGSTLQGLRAAASDVLASQPLLEQRGSWSGAELPAGAEDSRAAQRQRTGRGRVAAAAAAHQQHQAGAEAVLRSLASPGAGARAAGAVHQGSPGSSSGSKRPGPRQPPGREDAGADQPEQQPRRQLPTRSGQLRQQLPAPPGACVYTLAHPGSAEPVGSQARQHRHSAFVPPLPPQQHQQRPHVGLVAMLGGPAAAELMSLRADLMLRVQLTRERLAQLDPLDVDDSLPLMSLLERCIRMLAMLGPGGT